MDAQSYPPVTMAFGKAGLVAGTTSSLTVTTATPYTIRGKAYSKAAAANAASPTVDYATGKAFIPIMPGNGCSFLVGVDAQGNLRCVQGQVVPLDPDGNFINASGMGTLPNDFCPIGYSIVKAASNAPAAGWTFGASNWAGVTGVTNVFVDVTSMPDRPQIQ